MTILKIDFQKYFEMFQEFANDNVFLIILVTIFLAMLESFIPILPLVAIVGVNIAMFKSVFSLQLGTTLGLCTSIVGSFIGTFCVFCIIKYSLGKWFRRKALNNNKVKTAMSWIENRTNVFLILFLSNPYIPSSIFNYAMALSDFPIKRYLLITSLSRVICVSLLAVLGIIFNVGNSVMSFVWLTLTYVGIYFVFWFSKKIINYLRRKKDEKDDN